MVRQLGIVVVIATFVGCAFAQTVPICPRPDDCLNPCTFATCPAWPTAVCTPYYCGGRCEADFFINSRRVDCYYNPNATTQIVPTVPISICPPEPPAVVATDDTIAVTNATTMMTCLNLCNNCDKRGLVCCPSRGCGSECKQPIIWVPWNKPFDKPVQQALHKVPTVAPLRLLFGRCPAIKADTLITTCSDWCDHCEDRGQLCCSNGCGKICMDPVY